MIDKLVKKSKRQRHRSLLDWNPMLSYVPEYIKKTAFDEIW